ncbi:DUF7344 domain-containing protein [Halorarum salinum]|uniref:DUF7344 domain-containing protein n=1 Tax=Halorarum salinum TaxID=2743089 RepID=A0A7D5QC76_9EURY|nr:hypothetical protein [Halobaculum salinum]QLG62859.1 hypothetical protein HUG12_14430 [Halobaculum salinum]
MSTSDDRALKQSPTRNSSTVNRSESDGVGGEEAEENPQVLGGLQSGNDPEDLWDTMGSQRRRRSVEYCATREGVMIGDLADHNAALENDCPADQLDAQQRKRVYIALLQNHLPLLDEANIIDWDGPQDTVSRGDEFVTAHLAVETMQEIDAGEFRRQNEPAGLVGGLKAKLWGSA